MKKLFLIGALLCALCSCGSGNSKKSNVHEGHEWVDLGLPSGLKWATCNVGASSPAQDGNYYAWGETSPKTEYDANNCASYGEFWGDINGDPNRDAARANWGGRWRMPTKAEFEELVSSCDAALDLVRDGDSPYTWAVTFTSRKNGKSVVFPLSGFCEDVDTSMVLSAAYYWSSTPYENNTEDAYNMFCHKHCGIDVSEMSRYCGCSIRPVLD